MGQFDNASFTRFMIMATANIACFGGSQPVFAVAYVVHLVR